MQEVEVATVCFLRQRVGDSVRVLLGERLSIRFNGIWNAPGGHLNPKETIARCAIREVWEEIRVKVVRPSLKHFATIDFHYPNSSGHFHGWTVHYLWINQWEGDPQPVDGFSKVEWFDLDDLPYKRMMADQKVWLATAVADKSGRFFTGSIFYGDPDSKIIEKCSFEFVDRPVKPKRRRRK